MNFVLLILSAVLTSNFITVKTYGICPFLGVSKNTKSALGMGVAVTIVMALATAVTYPIYKYIMTPLNITFLWIIFFIFIIAALVQMLEAIIRKISPPLYNTMGVYLPLITTNCAVFGVTQLFNGVESLSDIVKGVSDSVALNFGWAVLYAVFAGIGFTLVMLIMSGMREKLNCTKVSKSLAGFPISMIAAAFICMAFMIFAQIKV